MKEIKLSKLGDKVKIVFNDDYMIIEATKDDLGERLTWRGEGQLGTF